MTAASVTVTVSPRHARRSRARVVGRHAVVLRDGQAPLDASGLIDRDLLLAQARAIFLDDVGMDARDFAPGGRYVASWETAGPEGIHGIEEGMLH